MSRVVVLRPEPGNAETSAAARRIGLEPISAPLFDIQPMAFSGPKPTEFDAVVFGSANALRCGGERLAAYRALPAYCVGGATADAARAVGFSIAAIGKGGIDTLLPALARDGRSHALHLAGQAHVSFAPPPGCSVQTVVVYRATALPLKAHAAQALVSGAVALLHSAEAARRFAADCHRLGLARATIAVACLGPRVARAVGSGWSEVQAAAETTDAALLALAQRMCQTAPGGVARHS